MFDTVTLAFGDWNLSARAVSELAHSAGGRLLLGHGVDHGIYLGRGVQLVERENLGRHGSDAHDAILFTLLIDGRGKRPRTFLRVLVWNVYVGQDPERVDRELAGMIREHCPDVMALAEAYRCRGVLGELAEGLGYWREQPASGEGSGCALLVRKAPGRKLLGRGSLRMSEPWIGPVHGRRKAPREYPRLRFRLASGRRVRALAIHFPTGGPDGGNGKAVRESIARVRRWVSWRSALARRK